MIFSSAIFLYLFLPLTILGYYLSPGVLKNYWLLAASLVFFAWGGISFTLILIVSILFNYFYGLQIQKHLDTPKGYRWLVAGVTTNLLLLGVFKYANFIIQNINDLIGVFSIPPIPNSAIALPIGISFYTFHSLSYLIDIYRKKSNAQRNIFDLSLYICMFSQLIAGPIIRYSDIWPQLRGRVHTLAKFSSGVERFLIGLAKKVLLANTFAHIADGLFATNVSDLRAITAWLGIVSYTLQIYCDFAGYSDMAIGLGRMFGFEFKENFNFPYIARSVQEFWRRWHISLSSFFRDYVYIPLGGNRGSVSRTYVNLILVFFLTGFWHGASWSFVVWGLFHGFFMILERLGLGKILDRIWKPFSIAYTLTVVMFAWVLFRSDTLTHAWKYWAAMLNPKYNNEQINLFVDYMNPEFYAAFSITILGMFGFFTFISRRIKSHINTNHIFTKIALLFYHAGSGVFYVALLIMCTMYLVAGTYNPFIYYRF
jgi:alginate O-acetyltransferase complex protein AlgI